MVSLWESLLELEEIESFTIGLQQWHDKPNYPNFRPKRTGTAAFWDLADMDFAP